MRSSAYPLVGESVRGSHDDAGAAALLLLAAPSPHGGAVIALSLLGTATSQALG